MRVGSIKYDMAKLADFDRFDLVTAAKNFDNCQDYFDKLTEVAKNFQSYLHSYNPDVVIYGEEVRAEFLDEFGKVRNLLKSLGMKSMVEELLNKMEEAIGKKKSGILSDLLLQFHAEMELLHKYITVARMPDNEASPAPAQAGGKPIIIAVDDNPDILTTISGVLEDKYKIIAMANGNSALEAMEMYSPALFLLDIEMPVINGYELAKRIRAQARFKNTPILFLTMTGDVKHVLAAKECGVNDYILKPVNKKLLLDKIEWHLVRNNH